MGAWNFKKQFAGKVESGEKLTTIRRKRKDGRDPRVGEKMMLYVGMRTKDCRKIGEAVIVHHYAIEICNDGVVVFDGRRVRAPFIASIARSDGFDSMQDFYKFFEGDFRGYWYKFKKKG